MKKFLEKIYHTFIPHEKNKNIPHILKIEFVFVIFIFLGILFYFNQNNFKIIQQLRLTATVYPAVLTDLTNKDRQSSGVGTLVWNDTLAQAAKLKAEDMIKNNYFAHTSPSGVSPWFWFREKNYNFVYAGENLAVDFMESENVQRAWLNSPKHKENIMNSNFTEIGIATADGFFEGKSTTFVVEFFGKPLNQNVNEKVDEKIVEKLNDNKKIEEIDINEKVLPKVAGVAKENIVEETISEDQLIIVEEKSDKIEKFIVVINEDLIEEDKENEVFTDDFETQRISKWYKRFIFKPTETIRNIYIVLLSLIFLSVILLLFKERQKHHFKHLFFGMILIIITSILLYIISVNTL